MDKDRLKRLVIMLIDLAYEDENQVGSVAFENN
jgi:hypothetical protein